MSMYRLWQLKRGDEITGPFPEPFICQQILVGRIDENDLISLDGHAWHSYREFPEIGEEIERLLDLHAESHDPAWHQERIRAARRYYDERKSPDRREHETEAQRPAEHDRREVPETVEQHTYRHNVAEVDGWLRRTRQHYGWPALALLVGMLGIAAALHYNRAVVPIDIGLGRGADCEHAPARGINWRGCNKAGLLLAGADLREADLSGADFSGANLSYANLTGARVGGARLEGTILSGATWIDGRQCAAGSVGTCR